MTGREVRPVGERALLVGCADLAEVLGLHAALSASPLPGQAEVLAAARTVLVRATDRPARDRLAPVLRDLPAPPVPPAAGDVVVIDTVYDGADLTAVAEHTGLSVQGVVGAHSGEEWTAAFGGFAPGFAYLVGPTTLAVPRRASPRTAVPAGSVALAGTFSAVYPRSSPGGWQLIGRTDAPMWDLDRRPPALLRPGDRVRFRPVRERVTTSGPAEAPGRHGPAGAHSGPAAPTGGAGESAAPGTGAATVTGSALTVLAAGAQSLLQDLGRAGLLDLGVSPSGAADRGSARQANRLVGNDGGAAVVETVLGGLELRATRHQVLAVSGAQVPLTILHVDEELTHPPTDAPFLLPDGHVLRLGHPSAGLRAYVAVRGGVTVPEVLGSRSTDLLSGVGPPPLAAGTVLPVGPPPGRAVGQPEPARVRVTEELAVGVVLGPRADRVTPESLERLLGQAWTVTDRSNRVGLRLDGAPLERADDAELDSEGTVAGAVQLPSDGRPVVFLADHPVTGGYPVLAVVRDADLDTLAQARPGDRLRFRDAVLPCEDAAQT
ncbi:sensor histidine kinase inhibitor, KipI family [Georgenia satyanarayanai]|uniref:Sensor histidine kinase inhibitor, KipI family n=1 Tax=Georgenia satyanarayanai TaxID=860221 RepID=A0A2Y8ZZM9_9MICO|nr:5-oxoprolinase/urea amidolyase family protein [Georgenia satyanarayanai]PYG02219.1 KipI family sensor histidine kinase inhibitor [Georgenia satyanarayanai]SSA37056.1 sensor histidine kinase inhibitor, KipI family [Georgenia satyanarayanai]